MRDGWMGAWMHGVGARLGATPLTAARIGIGSTVTAVARVRRGRRAS